MTQETDARRKTSSPILPLLIAGFAGATLAIACERPDARYVSAEAERIAAAPRAAPAQATPGPQAAPAAPAAATPAPVPAQATREGISDTVITGHVKTAILTDPAMAGADISVNTDRGVVSLTGTVKSHEQMGIASAYAQRQDGVMRVDNHLAANSQ